MSYKYFNFLHKYCLYFVIFSLYSINFNFQILSLNLLPNVCFFLFPNLIPWHTQFVHQWVNWNIVDNVKYFKLYLLFINISFIAIFVSYFSMLLWSLKIVFFAFVKILFQKYNISAFMQYLFTLHGNWVYFVLVLYSLFFFIISLLYLLILVSLLSFLVSFSLYLVEMTFFWFTYGLNHFYFLRLLPFICKYIV